MFIDYLTDLFDNITGRFAGPPPANGAPAQPGSSNLQFSIKNHFTPALATGGNRVDVVMAITAEQIGAALARVPFVCGFAIDNSPSMEGDKIYAAKHALTKIIDMLDEDTWFFVVAFHDSATQVVNLRRATTAGKLNAIDRIQRLGLIGGTNMSSGLYLSEKIFRKAPRNSIKHLLFLTDGQDNSDHQPKLKYAVDRCIGKFQVDCRGVGSDWHEKELLSISDALLGTTMVIPAASQIESDFRNLVNTAMSKTLKDARLRLWTPKTVRIESCDQVFPQLFSLSRKATQLDAQTREYPLGAWAPETRHYQLVFSIAVDGDIGERMWICRPSIAYRLPRQSTDTIIDGPPIEIKWESREKALEVDEMVAHYTGQTELRDTIRQALDLQAAGREKEATEAYGRAVKMADEFKHAETTNRLNKVVEIIDAKAGLVRIRSGVEKVNHMDLSLGSVRTTRGEGTNKINK